MCQEKKFNSNMCDVYRVYILLRITFFPQLDYKSPSNLIVVDPLIIFFFMQHLLSFAFLFFWTNNYLVMLTSVVYRLKKPKFCVENIIFIYTFKE